MPTWKNWRRALPRALSVECQVGIMNVSKHYIVNIFKTIGVTINITVPVIGSSAHIRVSPSVDLSTILFGKIMPMLFSPRLGSSLARCGGHCVTT